MKKPKSFALLVAATMAGCAAGSMVKCDTTQGEFIVRVHPVECRYCVLYHMLCVSNAIYWLDVVCAALAQYSLTECKQMLFA